MSRAIRQVVTGLVVVGFLGTFAGAAAAEPAWKSRFDPRIARLMVEDRLARQGATPVVQVEYSTPYLPPAMEDRSVDVRIRRLGELIRQQEQERR